MLDNATDMLELLENNGFHCKKWDDETIGICHLQTRQSLEEAADKVEKILDTLDHNIFTRDYDSFEDKNDTIVFADSENPIEIIVY